MWVLNFKSQTWAQVTSTGALPNGRPFPTGSFIGSSYFLLSADAPGENLWRWDASQRGGGGGSSTTTTNTIDTAGLGAGVAIAVLASVASLIVSIVLLRRVGTAPKSTSFAGATAGDAYASLRA